MAPLPSDWMSESWMCARRCAARGEEHDPSGACARACVCACVGWAASAHAGGEVGTPACDEGASGELVFGAKMQLQNAILRQIFTI